VDVSKVDSEVGERSELCERSERRLRDEVPWPRRTAKPRAQRAVRRGPGPRARGGLWNCWRPA